ncbi:MAG TPA: glycosyltransferase family 2 protein [Bacteroidota bacterium]|nr:glycosyltransferase family 2 protein [Bacteroidota bacterium]
MAKTTSGKIKQQKTPVFSIVVSLKDEEESLRELYQKIAAVMQRMEKSFEVVFVDDGSTDGSFALLRELHAHHAEVKVIRFRKNYGKAAALSAGFKKAAGQFIITMDADLQDDPEEIPELLKTMGDQYDLVSGWKKKRRDSFIFTLPSRVANKVASKMSGLKIHDLNCGLKLYRSEVAKELIIYGDLYRYIPILAHQAGFRVGEKPVEHHSRKYGHSKYTVGKFYRGFLDLLTVLFTAKYIRRPLHLFGVWGLLAALLGFAIDGWLIGEKILYDTALGNRPLFLIGVLLLIVGVQFISIGLLGEMVSRSSRNEQTYSVREELL